MTGKMYINWRRKVIGIGLMMGVGLALRGDPGPFGFIDRGIADGRIAAKWTVLQISLLPVCPFRLFSESTSVYGLAINVWGNIWDDYGDNFGLALNGYAEGGNNYGLGIGVYQNFRRNYGVTAGLINGVRYCNRGLQLGVVNFFERYEYSWDITDGNRGVQLGLVNCCDQTRKMLNSRIETPLVNTLQIGLVNRAGSGWQFGLVNYNRTSPLPWCPLFNYSRSVSPAR